MENNYLADLWNSSPIVCVVLTGLVLLLVESVRRGSGRLSYAVSLVGLASAGVLIVAVGDVAQPAFNNMIVQGPYAQFFTVIFLVTGILTILLSRGYLDRQGIHRSEYYLLVVFAISGMMLLAYAMDLIVVFLGIELMSICLYILAGFMRTRGTSMEAALKYFLLGAFATGFLLYGIALIYGSTGTTNLEQIAKSFAEHSASPMFLVGVSFLLVAFAFKVAAVPFHMWAPDVYEGAPTMVTAFMSTGVKAAGFAAFVAVFMRSFQYAGSPVNDVLAAIAAASMIIGNVTALAQVNLKRMLAYSSVAHAGYILVGLAAGNADGFMGILFYLVAYVVVNVGAFGILSLVEDSNGQKLSYDDYAGFSAQRPFLAALMSIFMFSLAGIPPFAGFFGKYYVFLAAVKADMIWLAVLGVLTSLVSVYYYLRLVILMYFREGSGDVAVRPTWAAMLSIGFAAYLVIQFGIFPSIVVDAALKVF
ncbi:MAG: NADH-quinone oxidoreductase subunit N [Ignavibacteria bacterium]|nr:NADH-quinone oxidoreductase subunit N [Ignavibacteria bacterium]